MCKKSTAPDSRRGNSGISSPSPKSSIIAAARSNVEFGDIVLETMLPDPSILDMAYHPDWHKQSYSSHLTEDLRESGPGCPCSFEFTLPHNMGAYSEVEPVWWDEAEQRLQEFVSAQIPDDEENQKIERMRELLTRTLQSRQTLAPPAIRYMT